MLVKRLGLPSFNIDESQNTEIMKIQIEQETGIPQENQILHFTEKYVVLIALRAEKEQSQSKKQEDDSDDIKFKYLSGNMNEEGKFKLKKEDIKKIASKMLLK